MVLRLLFMMMVLQGHFGTAEKSCGSLSTDSTSTYSKACAKKSKGMACNLKRGGK